MSEELPAPAGQPPVPPPLAGGRRLGARLAAVGVAVVLLYLLVAYVLMPAFWTRYTHRHPLFDDIPGITRTGTGIAGDPLNVALVGTEIDVKKILLAAHWYPADPLTLKGCLEIAESSVLKRPYDDAPVSNLFLFGRKEDLAFD